MLSVTTIIIYYYFNIILIFISYAVNINIFYNYEDNYFILKIISNKLD